MKNNRLCAGLALLVCTATMPACAQAGSSGATPVQASTGQGLSFGRSAAVALGITVAGLGAYGLYRLYKRWSDYACREDLERTGRLLQGPTFTQVIGDLQEQVNASVSSAEAVINASASSVEAAIDASMLHLVHGMQLSNAARVGNLELVRESLVAGRDPNFAPDRLTPLMWAALSDKRKQIERQYREKKARLDGFAGVGLFGDAEREVLQVRVRELDAARRRYDTIVELLLAYGADPNKTDLIEQTALAAAAQRGYVSMVAALCAAGADQNHVDLMERTPLVWAVEKVLQGEILRDVARVLVLRGATPLTRAAYERMISRSNARDQKRMRTNLERLKPTIEQASLERKHAIESTLDAVKVDSARLPWDLQRLIIKMSEHPDVTTWWRKVERDRLCAVSDMRLPIEALKRIVTFDSPQDSRLFRGMLE